MFVFPTLNCQNKQKRNLNQNMNYHRGEWCWYNSIVTLFPKPHRHKTHAVMCFTHTNMHIHTQAHTHTKYSEPLKAIEQRVIIMRVNSRTPLSSSAAWCWELCPTGPAANGNPHRARCHCFKAPITHFHCIIQELALFCIYRCQWCVCWWAPVNMIAQRLESMQAGTWLWWLSWIILIINTRLVPYL